jgi:predicted dehydrogenase
MTKASNASPAPLKVGIIGMGPIGNIHADMYALSPLSTLAAICDTDKERADTGAARLGVTAYYDAQSMLDVESLDLCSISTGGQEYGGDHFAPTMQALKAGCHVLGEKPISNDVDEARKMVTLANDKGLCYGINLNHRFTPLARTAKSWVQDGRLGHLLFVNMTMWIKNPIEASPWFHIKALHPHTIDVMRYFCGDITAVQCFATKAPGRSIWSTAHFSLQFANGVVGGLTGSYDIARGHPMERCEVAGTKGRFVLDDLFQQLTLYPAGNPEKTVITNTPFGEITEKTFTDTFKNRIHRFVEQVAHNTNPDEIDGSGTEGLAAQEVLAAAIESVETGTVVQVTPQGGRQAKAER